MRLTWKDVAATALVAAIVIPYTGYLVRGGILFINDPREVAGTALVLGITACAVGGSSVSRSDVMVRIASPFGFVALGLGIATLITGNELLLAGFIATIVLLWVLATVHHAMVGLSTPTAAAPAKAEAPAK